MKRIILALTLVLCLALMFCACGDTDVNGPVTSTGDTDVNGTGDTDVNGTDDTSIDFESVPVEDFTAKIGKYTVIRPENADNDIKSLPSKLYKEISGACGVKIKAGTDWEKANGAEIILGNADRDACREVAALLTTDYDYAIRMVGDDLVIMGLTDFATVTAFDYFIANFIVDGKINFPAEDGVLYLFNPPVESFKIAGVDFAEFTFQYIEPKGLGAQSTQEEVNEISDRLGKEFVGQKLELVTDKEATDNMIYYDRSGLDYEKGGIKVENGDLYLYGSYHSINYVMDYFFDTVIGENKTVDIPEGYSVELSTDDLPTIYSKDDLMKVLEYVYDTDELTIVGDEMHNDRSVPQFSLDNFMDSTGTHPAILGVDLGRCGFKLPTLPENQWMIISQLVCELIDYAAQGGIITIGSHMTNPNPNYVFEDGEEDRGDLGNEQAWTALLTEGTAQNTAFKSELEMIATVFKALEEAGVPIIWRPFHEMNGGWFWWTPEVGNSPLDSKYFVDMWIYVYEYFEDEVGLRNLLWEYSPSTDSHIDVMYLYPGDEYCDMVGIDWYTIGNLEIFDSDYYYRLMETGKITNLAEMGIAETLMAATKEEQADLYTSQALMENVYEMYREDMKIGYFMNYTGKTGFLWLPGGDEVMQREDVVELKEMLPLFEQVTGFKGGN